MANVEVVRHYTYLSITFSATGKFEETTMQKISKVNIAIRTTKLTLTKAKPRSLAAAVKLFNSIVTTTLLYGVEIWGDVCLQSIVPIQAQYFKHILKWPRNTPNNIVRLEIKKPKLEVEALRRNLSWCSRLLEMPNSRLPKRCYRKLLAMRKTAPSFAKENWVARLESRLTELGFTEVFVSQNPQIIQMRTDQIAEALVLKIRK